MKTKIYMIGIIFSIMLFSNIKGYSQNWAPVGATWYFNCNGTPCGPYLPIISYVKLVSENDIIINGWNCKKIVQSNPDNDFEINYFMYSDGNKVYEVENNQKYLLYDFNKKTGEYWILPKYDNDSVFVDSIGSITLENGQIRKVQYVHLNSSTGMWFFTGRIIENIGFEYSLFPHQNLVGGTSIGKRRCYFENSLALLKSDIACDYQNINEIPIEQKVLVCNPVTNYVLIEILDYRIMPITDIILYNSNGAIVYHKKDNMNWPCIDVSDKTPGVYFIKFTFKDNQTLIKKIIKY